jgi:hypothetical protein
MWATVVRRSAAAAVSEPMAIAAHSMAVMKLMVGGVGRKARTFGEDLDLGFG